MSTIEQQVREAVEGQIKEHVERLTRICNCFAKERHVDPSRVALTIRPEIRMNPSLAVIQ